MLGHGCTKVALAADCQYPSYGSTIAPEQSALSGQLLWHCMLSKLYMPGGQGSHTSSWGPITSPGWHPACSPGCKPAGHLSAQFDPKRQIRLRSDPKRQIQLQADVQALGGLEAWPSTKAALYLCTQREGGRRRKEERKEKTKQK